MNNYDELLESYLKRIIGLLKSCNDIILLDLIEKILIKSTKENDRQCNN